MAIMRAMVLLPSIFVPFSQGADAQELSEAIMDSSEVTSGVAANAVPADMQWEPAWRDKGDCGPMSLYTIMRLLGEKVSVSDVKAVVPINPEFGCSLTDIARGADRLSFDTSLRYVNSKDLRTLPGPFIYHVEGSLESGIGHFGVVVGYSPDKREYAIINTTYGKFGWVPESAVEAGYSGYVLLPRSRTAGAGWSFVPIVVFWMLAALFAGLQLRKSGSA